MTDGLVEALGEAIDAVDMFARFNDWTGDHVPGLPIEICRNIEDDDIAVVARYPGRNEKDSDEHLARHIKEARAQAALAAIKAHGLVVVPVEQLEQALNAPMIDHSGRKSGVYDIIRAMIAAAGEW